MRRFKFNKPIVESAYPPESKNVLWVDINESTGSIISIKEFKKGDWVDIVSNQQLVDAGVDVNPNFPEPNEIYYYSKSSYPMIDTYCINNGYGDPDLHVIDITNFTHPKWGDVYKITFNKNLPEEFPWNLFSGQSNSSDPPIIKIWLPKHTKYISYASFYNCGSLQFVYLPEGVVGIGDKSFLGSNAKVNYMESGDYTICFPSTIKYVGTEAFALASLGSINFPKTPDYISSLAFQDSDVLSICINDKSLTREKDTFYGDVYRNTCYNDAVHFYLEVSSNLDVAECLLPGTQILVDVDGTTKNIEDLEIGDTIITYNKGKYIAAELDKVVDVKHNYYVDVTFEDDTKISISADHAILTEEGWKSYRPFLTETPENVQPFYTGDKVLVNGKYIKIKSIILYSKPNTVMYNIGVKGYNNYIANGVCVYECSGSN